MNDHMTAYLANVKSIIPYLQEAYHLVGADMEDEDVERVVTDVDQRPLQPSLTTVNPQADVISHQESKQSGHGQRKELRECRTPVHVGYQIYREKVYDGAKDDGGPKLGMMTRDELAVFVNVLPEDETAAEKEAAHHVAIATLNQCDHIQSLVCFPSTE